MVYLNVQGRVGVLYGPLILHMPPLYGRGCICGRGQLKCDGTHAQKPDFVFRRNGQVHLNQRGHQFSRLLAAEMCASAVVMLDTPCSEVV